MIKRNKEIFFLTYNNKINSERKRKRERKEINVSAKSLKLTEIVEGANTFTKACTIEGLITDEQTKQILLKMHSSSHDPKKK